MDSDSPYIVKASSDTSSETAGGGYRLNLFDATCLIVGIIIGSGIYETPALVATAVDHPWEIYLLWALGGVISLCGALCYAELASAYPESGGDVIYLSKAYGGWAGFLFGWLQTFVARPGDISMMALVFARYVHLLIGGDVSNVPVWPAIAVVVFLTGINMVGLQFGKTAQNVLTVGKVLGLLTIVGVAFAGAASAGTLSSAISNNGQPTAGGGLPKGVAIVLILFTYGGWNEMVYVASEVENPRRNIWKALLLGTLAVMAVYLLTNAAYLSSLTLSGMAGSNAIATDSVSSLLPKQGLLIVAAVIAISSAGALNGLILTGARITGAMKTIAPFDWLGKWSPRFKTPVRALLLECAIAIAVICIAKTFANALIYTASAVYTFYLATCLSSAVLRFRDPNRERPFRMPLFPLPLLVFGAGCLWAIRSAVDYNPTAAVVCFSVISAGVVFYGAARATNNWRGFS